MMRPFAYRRAEDARDAVASGAGVDAMFVAGATELLSLWKTGAVAPAVVVDISGLPFDRIEARDGAIVVGALARLVDVAAHPLLRATCPVVTDSVRASASPQLRNMATVGGNLLQRTRCAYFRDVSLPCNKRAPGTGCGAFEGDHRRHAIFGTSELCVAAHGSDLAVALVALDSAVRLLGPAGERSLPLAALYRTPGDRADVETLLAPGELVTAVEIPRRPWTRRSCYLKLGDRAAFDFAIVSVAAALQIENGIVRTARLAAGGVGTTPWRLAASEAALLGARHGVDAWNAAAERSGDGARPLARNGYKVELLKRTVRRALEQLA